MDNKLIYLNIVILLLNLLLVVYILIRIRRRYHLKELKESLSKIDENRQALERVLREEMLGQRQEINSSLRYLREETTSSFKNFEDSLLRRINESENSQKNLLESFSSQLASLTQMNEQRMEKVRDVVQERLSFLQEENSRKLDQMRAVVEDKLHSTLEKRLGESFRLVRQQLDSVHEGLGKMQSLASSVGDLKKVLTNVKTRGVWGEIQLGILLEQILAPEQYESNVVTKKGSSERVEFAIKLPGRENQDKEPVWLPIDAKFPQEDYQRLLVAQEEYNQEARDRASKQLEGRIKTEAKNIRDKYIDPPNTTDFAIMFLPVESLYAEVLRRPSLIEFIQRESRVAITGPTTLAALLNSLQMGFRTLAIEKRSSEVWNLLGSVKAEFDKFGNILDKTRKKLTEAANTIDHAASKTRNIQGKLRDVQRLGSEHKAAGDSFTLGIEEDEEDAGDKS